MLRLRAAGVSLTGENTGTMNAGAFMHGSSQRFLSMPGGIQEADPFPATTL